MEKLKTPTLSEALEGQQKAVTEKIVNTVENEDLSLYLPHAEELLQKHSAIDLVAAVLKSMTKEPDASPIKLTDEAPAGSKRGGYKGSNSRPRNGSGGGRSSGGGRKDYGGAKRTGGGSTNRKSNGYGNRSSSTSSNRDKINK